MGRFALLMAVSLLAACGTVPPGSESGASATRTTSGNLPSPKTPVGWQTYADAQFGFSIAYPPESTVQDEGGDPASGYDYRVFDRKYTDPNGYPRGQVEFAIYSRDAASLPEWVARHTGEPTGPSATTFPNWN